MEQRGERKRGTMAKRKMEKTKVEMTREIQGKKDWEGERCTKRTGIQRE